MTDAAMQSAQSGEQTFVQNPFGTVTGKRVIYYRSKGWISGGSREDIPLQHVTSVVLHIQRSIVAGLLFLLMGLGLLAIGKIAILFGVIFVALAALQLWGSPTVVVNTAGRDLSAARGWPWQRDEANAFVEALRAQLFRA
jgi:hypothetical protein